MGRLAGFAYRDVVRRMTRLGFVRFRRGKGSHEMWVNATTRRSFTVSAHAGDIAEGTIRNILRQAGIAEDDFLA